MASQVYQFTCPEECCWGPGVVTLADTLPASATRDADPPTGPKDTIVEAESICPTPQISMSPVLLSHLLQNNLIFNQGSMTGQYTSWSKLSTVNAEFLALILRRQLWPGSKCETCRSSGLGMSISLCYATITRNAAGVRTQLKSTVTRILRKFSILKSRASDLMERCPLNSWAITGMYN